MKIQHSQVNEFSVYRDREREVYFPNDEANTKQCTSKSSPVQMSKYKQERNTTSWGWDILVL